jgi:hypothetical protein
LQRFATNTGVLAVVDRDTGRRYKSSVANAAVEVGYYDIDMPGHQRNAVESEILSPLEGRAKHAVEQLLKVGPSKITIAQRGSIAAFVAAQILRGKDQESISNQIADVMLKAQIAGMTDAQLREASPTPLSDEDIANVRRPDAFKVQMKGAVIRALVQHLEGFTRVLMKGYDWTVVRYEHPCVFTSDVPVCMSREPSSDDFGGIGIISADILEMPLDPTTVLRLHNNALPGRGCEEQFVVGTLPDLQPLLERLVNHSQRWVFAHPQNPLYEGWIPTLPPQGPRVSGGERLIDLATKMRIAHETEPTAPPIVVPDDDLPV